MCKTNISKQISPYLEKDISEGWLWFSTFVAVSVVFIAALITS